MYDIKKIVSKNISNWVKEILKKQSKIKKIVYFKKRYPEDGEIDYLNENNLLHIIKKLLQNHILVLL